jgi:hypothetical protein
MILIKLIKWLIFNKITIYNLLRIKLHLLFLKIKILIILDILIGDNNHSLKIYRQEILFYHQMRIYLKINI